MQQIYRLNVGVHFKMNYTHALNFALLPSFKRFSAAHLEVNCFNAVRPRRPLARYFTSL
jgi:hypothetical protein